MRRGNLLFKSESTIFPPDGGEETFSESLHKFSN
jgi:hypothetical protein